MKLARISDTHTSLINSETMLSEGIDLPKEPDIDPRLQILLARCLAGLGKRTEARAELTRLIAAYPAHPVTKTAKRTLEDLR